VQLLLLALDMKPLTANKRVTDLAQQFIICNNSGTGYKKLSRACY